MNETFLHYVWETSQFEKNHLKTTSGESISIQKPGFSHLDGGPDFVNARIKIDQTLWVGQVEIHVKSSDWFQHNHQNDPTYDTTILHVVFEDNREVFRTNGTRILCIELKNRIPEVLLLRYDQLVQNSHRIPCEALVQTVPQEIKNLCVEAMAVDRLQEKTEVLLKRLKQLNNDWNELFYQEVCSALGLRINKVPFALLAKHIPNSLLARHKNNLKQVEALLFGTAGFLKSSSADPYERVLYDEYQFLKSKYDLEPIDVHLWKFLRLRPANFPTVRLAQMAMLIHKSEHLFSKIRENLEYLSIKNLFQTSVSDYWKQHYGFGTITSTKEKNLGNNTIDIILINAIVPLFFCYAHHLDDVALRQRVFDLLDEIKSEKNKTTTYFQSTGFSLNSALHSQGILQLHNKFCTFKNCLKCQIGHFILKNSQNQ